MTERLHFRFSLSCTGEGNGNPLQCSCLENPRDGGAWWAAVYGVAQSQTRLKRLSSSSAVSNQCRNDLNNTFFRPLSDEWQESHLFMEQPTSSLDSYTMLFKINKNLLLSIISALWKDRILNVFSKLELWSMDLFSKISNIPLLRPSSLHMTASGVSPPFRWTFHFAQSSFHCVLCVYNLNSFFTWIS